VATNLSLRAELVQRAKELGLNISELLDAALEEAVQGAEAQAWRAENQDAITAYNAQVEKRRVFSSSWRRF
jgi:antitoxin CcdA